MNAILTNSKGEPIAGIDETDVTMLASEHGDILICIKGQWAVKTSKNDDAVTYRTIRHLEALRLLGPSVDPDRILQLDTIDLLGLNGVVKVAS